MEENVQEMNTKKAIYISSAVLAPLLLIFYWQPILEIVIVGGTAFGIFFLLVKHHKIMFRQAQKCQEWLAALVSCKENENSL